MRAFKKELTMFAVMIALAIITAVLNPLFLGGDNLRNNLRHISLISLFALGEAMVIIAGGIDLSIGSIICVTAVSTSYLAMYGGVGIGAAVAISLAAALVVGVAQGTILARFTGIPVAWIRLFTFIGAAALSGVAGMLYVAYLPTATPSLGNAFELHAIAAAVLGGCSLQGGKGTVFGVLIGAGILQITFNAVHLVGQSLWQNVVAGGVILAAVIVDKLFEKSRTFGGGVRSA